MSSLDGAFTISPKSTLTKEEVSTVMDAAFKVVLAGIKIFNAAALAGETGDPSFLARDAIPAAITMYEEAMRIKREIED